MGQVLDGLIALFAPPVCFSCGEGCKSGHICPLCLQYIDFIQQEERCFRCFTELRSGACYGCRYFPLIYRRGALFEREEVTSELFYHKSKQAQLIASLFTLQFLRLKWPLFDYVAAEPSLKRCANLVATHFQKKVFPRGCVKEGANILYLSSGIDEVKFPFSICSAKVFHLSFFLSI